MIISALKKSNGLVSVAAKRLQCNTQTIYNRLKAFPVIQQVIDEAREELVDLAEQKLKTAVKKGEFQAIALVLKTLGKNRGYVERSELNAGVSVAGDVVEHIVIHLPDNGR